MIPFGIIFPGQGSQHVGMFTEFSKDFPEIKFTFHEASEILDYNLWKLVQYGPNEKLNYTFYTQTAIVTASIAIWRLWKTKIKKIPDYIAGHSLGEYSALVCSEILDFPTVLKLVSLRSLLMQNAVPKGVGAMSAIIGLDKTTISNICEQESKNQIVSLGTINSPDQVIISGHKIAVNRVNNICKSMGAKYTIFLPISIPSHCELMKIAAHKFSIILEFIKFKKPKIPIINNVEVYSENDPLIIKQLLIRQLYSPVLWYSIIEFFIKNNIKLLIEVGPGKVLTKLNNFTSKILNLSLSSTKDFYKIINYFGLTNEF